jgi:hypothetical protein
MYNFSFYKKILHNRKLKRRRIIRNAKRGAARPWSLGEFRNKYSKLTDKQERVDFFNDNISHIFPLILDLSAQGLKIATINKTLGLTHRMLWQWLNIRPELMELVLKARELGASRVLKDWDDLDPLSAL